MCGIKKEKESGQRKRKKLYVVSEFLFILDGTHYAVTRGFADIDLVGPRLLNEFGGRGDCDSRHVFID